MEIETIELVRDPRVAELVAAARVERERELLLGELGLPQGARTLDLTDPLAGDPADAPPASFDAVIALRSRLAGPREADRWLVARMFEAARPGGWIVIDVLNRDALVAGGPEPRPYRLGSARVEERRALDLATSRLHATYVLRDADGQRAFSAEARVYSRHELAALWKPLQPAEARTFGDWEGGAPSARSPRLVTALRRAPVARWDDDPGASRYRLARPAADDPERARAALGPDAPHVLAVLDDRARTKRELAAALRPALGPRVYAELGGWLRALEERGLLVRERRYSGTVVAGTGKAAEVMAAMAGPLGELLGARVVPGTLNVLLDAPPIWPRTPAAEWTGDALHPDLREFSYRAFEVDVSGLRGFALLISETPYPRELLEIVGAHHFRGRLALGLGARVTVTIV